MAVGDNFAVIVLYLIVLLKNDIRSHLGDY